MKHKRLLVSIFAAACLCGGALGLASGYHGAGSVPSNLNGIYCKDEPVISGHLSVLNTFGAQVNSDHSLTFGVSVVDPKGNEFNMYGTAKSYSWGWEYNSTDSSADPGGVCKMDFKASPDGNWEVTADPVANCAASQGWGMSFPTPDYTHNAPMIYTKKDLQSPVESAMQSPENFYKAAGGCAKETRPIPGSMP